MPDDPDDRPGPQSGAPFDPLLDAGVRRLLAEVRVDEPAPPAVVARLDAVLADLAAGREPGGSTTPVPPGPRSLDPTTDELAARRRRRSWALAAAAAVVVLGVGGTVVQGLGGSLSGADDEAVSTSDAGGSAAEEPAAGQGGPESAAERFGGETGSGRGEDGGGDGADGGDGDRLSALLDRATLADAPAFTRSGFVDEVTRLVRSGRFLTQQTAPLTGGPEATDRSDVEALSCTVDAGPDDLVVAARYAGAPALLVLGPERPTAQGPGRVVDLVVCGRDRVERSVLVTP